MKKIAVVMHPLSDINPKKDTSFAMMLAGQLAGMSVAYIPHNSLFIQENTAFATCHFVTVHDGEKNYYTINKTEISPLTDFDVVLMRNDPPVDESYIQTTFILDKAVENGVLVANHPQAVRNLNEKLFATQFPHLIPDYVYGADIKILKAFITKNGKAIAKPIDGMGGRGIFFASSDDVNIDVILETLTHHGKTAIIVQKFIPEVKDGDKRILILNGKVFPFGLLRVPQIGSVRGNLAAGGSYALHHLTENDYKIANDVAISLVKNNISIAGIDVIGDYLTEINITSPTGLREIFKLSGQNPATVYLDGLLGE